MAYRDPLGAAQARLTSLEQQLAQQVARGEAGEAERRELEAALAAARAEVAQLRVLVPGTAAHNRRPFTASIYVGLGLVVATVVAGSQSESFGMMMSYVAVLPLSFGVGGMLGATHSRKRGYLFACVAAVLGPLALAVFFNGIWPSL